MAFGVVASHKENSYCWIKSEGAFFFLHRNDWFGKQWPPSKGTKVKFKAIDTDRGPRAEEAMEDE